jgi:type VI secretion system secreted protein Hcp
MKKNTLSNRPALTVEPLEDRQLLSVYLNFNGPIGDAGGEPSHKGDWIELQSFQFGVGAATGSKGTSPVKPSVSDFHVVHLSDKASPKSFGASCNNTLPENKLNFHKADKQDPQPYLQYTLNNTMVSGVSLSGSGDNRPQESVSLNFSLLPKFDYKTPGDSNPQDAYWKGC